MTARRRLVLALPLWAIAARQARSQAEAGFDHRHAAWEALLRQHVLVSADGHASRLRYAALQLQRSQLRAYLDTLSSLAEPSYAAWTRPQQLAFLINAYNAFTVELVLTRYPQLASIKDLGSLVRSPWKKSFFRLLGRERSLDDLEHGLIRAPGVFDDARVHVALVCASIGCPMLRNEAYVAERLDAQLDDAMRRFLSDRSRNRFDAASGTLWVSRIFDWYGKDFERGGQGTGSLRSLFARHAEQLAPTPPDQAALRAGRYRLDFLDYDWGLNDAR